MADKSFKVLEKIQKYFSKKGIKYTTHSEKARMFVSYNSDNFKSVQFISDLTEEGRLVSYHAFSLFKAKEDALAACYKFCNMMNCQYRWVRSYMDNDDEFTVALDAVLNERTAGEECYELLARMVNITDDIMGEYKKLTNQ